MPIGANLGQAGQGFFTLFNALGGGGIGGAGGSNMASATGAQQSAAANAAGLTGGFANPRQLGAQDAQLQGLRLQNQMTKQTMNLRDQFFAMLLGRNKGAFANSGGIGDLMAELANYGSGRQASINQTFNNAQGTALARLQNSGIANSNLTAGAIGNVARQRQLALGELGDDILSQKIGIRERALDRDMQLNSLIASLLK